MKIGIISDSHDHLANIEKVCSAFRDMNVAAVIHAGDFVAPFAVKRLQQLSLPVWAVRGNNDGEIAGLRNAFSFMRAQYSEHPFSFALGERSFSLQHIPQKWDDILGAAHPPDVLVCGHTHQRYIRHAGEEIVSPNSQTVTVPAACPTLIINPGELCGWLSGQATFVTLDTDTLREEVHFL